MNAREKRLLNFLLSQSDWTTTKSISLALNFSPRSIRTYISNINESLENSIESSNLGYRVNSHTNIVELLNSDKSFPSIPQSSEERKLALYRNLLTFNKHLSIDDISNEFHITEETLLKELTQFKEELKSYNLTLSIHDSIICISGQEAQKKKVISNLIHEDSMNSFFDLQAIQTYFPKINIIKIQTMIENIFLDYELFIDDFSLMSFIIHLCIAIERATIQQNYTSINPTDLESTHALQITIIVCDEINKEFDIKLSDIDVFNLSLILSTRVSKISDKHLTRKSLDKSISSPIRKLFLTIEQKIKNRYDLEFNNDNLLARFYIHISNLISRLGKERQIRNPMAEEIKNNYMYIYDVAVYIAHIISSEYGHQISENEIAYIAIHLVMLIKEEKTLKNKLSVVLVNPNYYDSNLIIKEELQRKFDDEIYLSNIISLFHNIDDYSSYDLIITTVDIKKTPPIPYVKISPFFSSNDSVSISNEIERIKKEKLKVDFESKIKLLFKEELFFFYNEKTKKDKIYAIETTCNSLIEQGYVDEDFKEKIYHRESISPCAFGNIALPHPLSSLAKKSAISVLISPKGIQWNENEKVLITLTLAITQDDQRTFKSIFDLISEILINPTHLDKLIKQETYTDFISTLLYILRKNL